MKMNVKSVICRAWWMTILAFTMLGTATGSFAQNCKAPTAEKQAELSAYVAKRSHISSSGQLNLLESAQANNACYWKLRYQSPTAKNDITVYLTPDGKYLVPNLYDLSIDPQVEERAATEKLRKVLEAGGPPSRGDKDAPITIVEFSDFECPYCKRMTDVLENGLSADDRKDVRIVFRNYPLPIHPWAKDAAEVAGCAALQSDAAFWKVHDYVFQNQSTFKKDAVRDNVTAFALENAGVDKMQFQACLDKKMAVGGVTQDMDLGNGNGVHATPTLFINGTKYEGAKDAAALRTILSDIRKSQMANAATPKAAAAR